MVLDTGYLMRLLRATVIRASVKKRRINRPDIFVQSDPAIQKALDRSCMPGGVHIWGYLAILKARTPKGHPPVRTPSPSGPENNARRDLLKSLSCRRLTRSVSDKTSTARAVLTCSTDCQRVASRALVIRCSFAYHVCRDPKVSDTWRRSRVHGLLSTHFSHRPIPAYNRLGLLRVVRLRCTSRV